MAIPDEDRGVGVWFVRKREQHGYGSQRKLLDAMRAKGIAVPESMTSVYAEIESRGLISTPARRRFAEKVAAFYGEKMPEPSGPAGQGSAELIAALTRQTTALEDLVKRLDGLAADAIREGVRLALEELRRDGGSQSAPPQLPQP